MQPFVTLWGFSISKLQFSHIKVVALYLFIIFLLLIPTIFLAKVLFKEPKSRSIFTIAGFVGNTGNIGIPLGIALFGEESAIYTTLINLANVFVVYGLGVYIYSRGTFSVKKSLINVLKIPIIPTAVVAIMINLSNVEIPHQINELIKMGAYGGIVLQLLLLGTFLESIKIKEMEKKLYIGVLTQKFILIPLATFFILSFIDIDTYIKNILLMQMLTPLAVANINLASLYDCRPRDVTNLIFISTLLFIAVLIIFKGLIL
jgi:predicted permease